VVIVGFTHESEVLVPSMEEVERAREILRSLPNGDKLEGSGAFKVAEILRKKVNAKGG
jgi:Mg-chelatase subunit ChlD